MKLSKTQVWTESAASDPRFLGSSREEIQVLIYSSTYVVFNESDFPSGATVLKSRVVQPMKTDSIGDENFKT